MLANHVSGGSQLVGIHSSGFGNGQPPAVFRQSQECVVVVGLQTPVEISEQAVQLIFKRLLVLDRLHGFYPP